MSCLALGIDLGTSGIRSAVLDHEGCVLSMARGAYPPQTSDRTDANDWWAGTVDCLRAQIKALTATGIDTKSIHRIGVNGTSGSLVLTDAALRPVTRGLMYNDGGFEGEADQIAAVAPNPHITRGTGSALARMLRLCAEDHDGAARHLQHQADFIAARLIGHAGYSDHNNTLKLGFDPESETWPAWFGELGISEALLPQVLPAGAPAAQIAPAVAQEFGLSPEAVIHVGTTDSIAAFLAAAPLSIGAAVTSLGTTLAVKLLSEKRIDDPSIGLYSHRVGDAWLVGGASNTGGGVLLKFFTPDALATLSAQIDPSQASDLNYYPLSKPGERFPVNDPTLPPRLDPRPADDAAFLHGLLESIARIEARCYEEMEARGAPKPNVLYTAGGGSKNVAWKTIRERVLGTACHSAQHTEAAIGTARLVQTNS